MRKIDCNSSFVGRQQRQGDSSHAVFCWLSVHLRSKSAPTWQVNRRNILTYWSLDLFPPLSLLHSLSASILSHLWSNSNNLPVPWIKRPGDQCLGSPTLVSKDIWKRGRYLCYEIRMNLKSSVHKERQPGGRYEIWRMVGGREHRLPRGF